MKSSRPLFLASAVFAASLFTGFALEDPQRDPVDLQAVKNEALIRFCVYMKRQNPHMRNWKKGELPTEKELKTLVERHPSVKKELARIQSEFYREIELDQKKRDAFRKKDESRNKRKIR